MGGQGSEGRSQKTEGGDPRGTGGWGGTGAPRQREAGPSCSRPGGAEPLRPQEPSLYTVKALLVLDSRGQRLLAKYYDGSFPTAQEQAAFESSVFSKTRGAGGEITCLDGLTVVYRSSSDLLFCVVGGPQENELMLSAVLSCLCDALGLVLRKDLEKRWLLENLDGAFLVLDEIVDRGVILESDPQRVLQRLGPRAPEPAPYGFVLFDYLAGSREHGGAGGADPPK
ncbi:coatomer subunit zeta-2 isoform X1 [Anas acuta]|uniref:coatomer subunit zeta-2 isoform X1 n=1 Tax=Anas acuta TaxID=28680 RepID=UPI0035C88FE7